MDFDVYDCKKIGFFKQNPDSLNFHDKALEKAEKKICNFYFHTC